ncbi:hypothetical protein B0H17DRAFT_1331596 [Mycena rosella]|uniref:F-box domain-containing protein n=1 Tax=Mycena rosella TaxID=1033263 RepID=A0AAD7GIP5_MYCRO|nr:hypothetical protein B0H17DRAFT_1331596 [Mycena rosella]
MYSQGRRVVAQSPQTRNQDGLARGASGAPSSRMSLSDVCALVKTMEARIVAQETKLQKQEEDILALKRDNSELWEEIHRLKGPRFPFEIFSSIILSMGEKKALKTFSLVSRGWMSVARKVLFKQISYSAMFWLERSKPIPILNNEHCTVFPYVQTIQIHGSTDDGSEYTPIRRPDWMDDFLRFIPKFVALRSLELYSLDEWDLQEIQRSMPPSIKNNIKEVSIDAPLSESAAFVSMFSALETFTFWNENSWYGISESTQGLVSPPSSIRDLLLRTPDPNVLKWFVDLHSGIIDSIDPHDLPFENPVEFGRFLTRFGSTLSKIKFTISGEEGAAQFFRSGYCAALPQLDLHTFSYSYFDKSFLSTIEWLPKILALLPPSIGEIILSMNPNQVSPSESAAPKHKLGTINWSRLDQSLTGSQYPSLRILKIRMSCPYHPKEVKQEMEEMWPKLLPICAKKGIMEPLITTGR